MNSTLQDTKVDHAKQSAISTAEHIVELVRALDRSTAEEDYCHNLTREDSMRILGNCRIEYSDAQPTDELQEMIIARMGGRFPAISDDDIGFEWDEDSAREAIQEHPLEVCVRSGWVASKADMEPEEFMILLGTGGPACRIRGELSGGEPSRAWIEYQDWGTPWTELVCPPIESDTLLTYCSQFYFGE